MGKIFENICQQFILYYGQEIKLPLAKRIGQIWEKDFDIDVAAENIDGSYTFAECKWSNGRFSEKIAAQLQERIETLRSPPSQKYLIIFTKNGFPTPIKNVIFVDIDHLIK